MKNRNFKIGALLVSLFAASCSPALYQSGTYNIDDMYAEHDVTRIAQEKQAIAEARKAEAEAHRAEIEARQAEAAYYASDDSYQGVLADTYESAYARRLRGFSSPTYQMPTSYFNLRYNGTYQFVSAYDPAVYNIIVMGDEVWVEPKYITSMFGTWGSPSIVSFGWSAGLYNDWYFSWGYNPYPWAYPGFGWPYYSYNPYWGYPYWGGYYPYWGYYPGWGGGHHHHPYPPHHRPNVVHRSTYRYGSGAGSNIGSTSFGGRGQGSLNNGYRNGTTVGSGSFRGGRTNSNSSSSFRGGSSSVNRGSSTYRNPSFGGSSSSYRGSSSTTNRGTYTPAPSQPNRGSSGSFVGGGGGANFDGRRTGCTRRRQTNMNATTGFDRQRRSFPPLLSRTPETKKQLNDFCYETSRNFGAAFSGLVRNRPGVGSKLRRFIDGP